MLYDYKFTLSEMTQIKNWKKRNTFDHILLDTEELELKTFEVENRIAYKRTVPLNMFEKYAIKLIQRSEEIHSSINMNITNIAKLLHLDERLIGENLENLEAIGMLNGVRSDIITINSDNNAEYLQYENKFKIEYMTKVDHLTKAEYENLDEYLKKDFENNIENRDKKFTSSEVLKENASSKNVHFLHYNDNNFLIYSNGGINSQNDLKFLDKHTLENTKKKKVIPTNIVCHYDEFLPLLNDILKKNGNEIVLIGTFEVNENNLIVLPNKNIEDIYILSDSKETHKRIFQIYLDDFLWIGDDLYQKNGEFVVKQVNRAFKVEIQEKLNNYFLMQIQDIFPEYDYKEIAQIDRKIQVLETQINQIKTKKETDLEIQTLNRQKNKLYGYESDNARKRSELRRKIDILEKDNNQDELKRYPAYLENREMILTYKRKVTDLELQMHNRDKISKEIDFLKKKRETLLPDEIKKKIAPFEKELKNLKRLKI